MKMMQKSGRPILAMVAAVLLGGCSTHPPDEAREKVALAPRVGLPMVCNGVTTTDDGHIFVCFPHPDSSMGLRVAEATPGGSLLPVPDLKWNSYKTGDDPTHTFVGVNALRMGPDGLLWVVDTGTTGSGTKVVPGGAKLVAIDAYTHVVMRIIPLGDVSTSDSFIDDIRFNGNHLYITDAGAPAIIVLDLTTGKGRRVLENDPSTTDRRPMYAGDRVLLKMDGTEARLHADQLEVSPDGQTFYFQPASGPMSSIDTRTLDDEMSTPATLAAHVHLFFDSPTTGGTAIDSGGNIYLSDVDRRQILKIDPTGRATVIAKSPRRLVWGDAMWIDRTGALWIPAAQLDRVAPFNAGVPHVRYPVTIYSLDIGAGPLRN